MISAIPEPDPDMQRDEIVLRGEQSSAQAQAAGCPFAPRCHAAKLPSCETALPPLIEIEPARPVACHLQVQ